MTVSVEGTMGKENELEQANGKRHTHILLRVDASSAPSPFVERSSGSLALAFR